MKLVTFLTSSNEQHIGALGSDEALIVDFTKTDSAPHFRDMLSLIDGGPKALDQARALRESAKAVVLPAAEQRLLAPVPEPRQMRDCLCFEKHLKQASASPELIPSLVSEIIRYQTPVLHMRRTARNDLEFAGRRISRGDKVVMWYISGNRDEEKIDHADQFVIDRAKPRQHLSFGAGIHRCVGDRLAEQQLRILWQEILLRNLRFEIVGAPQRLYSNFIRGIRALPVRIVS